MPIQDTSTCRCEGLIGESNLNIFRHSMNSAFNSAALLWGLVGAQYPRNDSILTNYIKTKILEELDFFAINARRALEIFVRIDNGTNQVPTKSSAAAELGKQFTLTEKMVEYSFKSIKIQNLNDALNFIIHAQGLVVHPLYYPSTEYYQLIFLKTDRRDPCHLDVFSLIHCFLYKVRPVLLKGVNH